MKQPITQKQQDIFRYICYFYTENGASPTLREIADTFGLKSPSTAQYYVEILKRKGYLEHSKLKARGIKPVEDDTAAAKPTYIIDKSNMTCKTCKRKFTYTFHLPDSLWKKTNGKKEGYMCAHCALDKLGGNWEVNKIIRWRDSNIINEQTDEIPEVAYIETAGHLIQEAGDRITIARDKIGEDYRGIISIPKENIVHDPN